MLSSCELTLIIVINYMCFAINFVIIIEPEKDSFPENWLNVHSIKIYSIRRNKVNKSTY
jgi:hypothetical protein